MIVGSIILVVIIGIITIRSGTAVINILIIIRSVTTVVRVTIVSTISIIINVAEPISY